jgi:hypothetical protein
MGFHIRAFRIQGASFQGLAAFPLLKAKGSLTLCYILKSWLISACNAGSNVKHSNVKHSSGDSKADTLPPSPQVAPESAPQTPIAPRLQPDSQQAQSDASQAQPDAAPALSVQNLGDTQLEDQHNPTNVQATGRLHQLEGQQECLKDAEAQYTASSEQQEYSDAYTTDPELQPSCKSGLPADQNAATGGLLDVNTGSLVGIPGENGQTYRASIFTVTMRTMFGFFGKEVWLTPLNERQQQLELAKIR